MTYKEWQDRLLDIIHSLHKYFESRYIHVQQNDTNAKNRKSENIPRLETPFLAI